MRLAITRTPLYLYLTFFPHFFRKIFLDLLFGLARLYCISEIDSLYWNVQYTLVNTTRIRRNIGNRLRNIQGLFPPVNTNFRILRTNFDRPLVFLLTRVHCISLCVCDSVTIIGVRLPPSVRNTGKKIGPSAKKKFVVRNLIFPKARGVSEDDSMAMGDEWGTEKDPGFEDCQEEIVSSNKKKKKDRKTGF